MRASIVALLLTGGCAMSTHDVIKHAVSRHVYIDTENKAGSGIIIQTGVVLTVAHLLEVGSEIRVNGKPAKVIHIVPLNDLMVLKTETPDLPRIETGLEVTLLEEILTIGNPLDLYGVVGLGRIVKIDSKAGLFYGNGVVMPGFSGGGVYNMNGKLIGIVIAAKGADFGTDLMVVVPINEILVALASK